jgi:hypothetical protein
MTEVCFTHLSRRELRQMTLTRLGFDDDGDSSDMVANQINRYLWSASLRANERVDWKHAQRQIKFTLGKHQGSVGYPPGCGPGSIIQFSVWLDGTTQSTNARYALYPAEQFVPLANYTFKLDLDKDPKWEAGGQDMEDVVGFPLLYACRDTILVRPLTDMAREAKILFTFVPELRCDDDRTVMDGELLILNAMAQYYAYAEEQTNADRHERLFEQRVMWLRSQQASKQITQYMKGLDLHMSPDEEAWFGYNLGDAARFDFTPQPIQYDPYPV